MVERDGREWLKGMEEMVGRIGPHQVRRRSTSARWTMAQLVELEKVHVRPTTIMHWQLRDLVSCGTRPGTVYCTYEDQTLAYDTARGTSERVQQLGYEPTCMNVGYGYVAAGGANSQLDVSDLRDGQRLFHADICDNENNSVTFGKSPNGEVVLLVTNNDEKVRIYSVPRMKRLHTIVCPVPINYAALSPDGTHLVCVGDSPDTYLFRLGDTCTRVGTFRECEDAGMSCCWNPHGSKFAAASQDGTLCVWEFNEGTAHLVAKFKTEKEACRAVKWSSAPIDLLLYTEHRDRFHVVDGRTFDISQTITLPHNSHISGACFDKEGTRIYVGMEDGIAEYRINSAIIRGFPSGSII